MTIFGALVILALTISCTGHEQDSANRPSQPHSLPTVNLVWQLDSDSIEGLFESVLNLAVGTDGSVFLYLSGSEPPLLLAIDSTGLTHQFGQFGEGPGELRRAGTLFSNGDTVFVVGPGRAVVQAFTHSGKLIDERALPAELAGTVSMGLTEEALYFFKRRSEPAGAAALVRLDRRDWSVKPVLDFSQGFAAAAALTMAAGTRGCHGRRRSSPGSSVSWSGTVGHSN